MTTDTEAHARQTSATLTTEEPYPAFKPLMNPSPNDGGMPLVGNPVLMRTATRRRGAASSGPLLRIAGLLVILAAIAIGASDWLIHASRPPLIASATAPPSALENGPTVSAPALAPASAIAPHAKRTSVLARNAHRHAVRRVFPKARAPSEAGADVSAITTVAPIAPATVTASSPPVVAPFAPALVTPPAPPPSPGTP